MLSALPICRLAVLSLDEPKCKDVGGLHCLGGLTSTGQIGQQAPAQVAKQEGESENNAPAQQSAAAGSAEQQENPATGTENQLPVSAQSGAGQAVGAYTQKTNTAGALIAGIVVIVGLIAAMVFLTSRPGKPISGKKLNAQLDDRVGALKKLEQTIQNIDKKRKQ